MIALLLRGRENLAVAEKSWEDWTNTGAEGEIIAGKEGRPDAREARDCICKNSVLRKHPGKGVT